MTHRDAPPVPTAHLFAPLSAALVALLRTLPADAWDRSTSARDWTVRDVAAHLLDVELRRLSSSRDQYVPAPARPSRDYSDLLAHLNALNAEWVQAARRLSPRVLTDCLAWAGAQVAGVVERADPWAEATFAVAWTGDSSSPMWLDIGREYTERWHHQDQIRDAAGAPPLRSETWLRPVLEISLLALPHAYRSLTPVLGTAIVLDVAGEARGRWTLEYRSGWTVMPGGRRDPDCTIAVGDLDLARLLLHRLRPDEARTALRVDGPAALAAPLLQARAVMV